MPANVMKNEKCYLSMNELSAPLLFCVILFGIGEAIFLGMDKIGIAIISRVTVLLIIYIIYQIRKCTHRKERRKRKRHWPTLLNVTPILGSILNLLVNFVSSLLVSSLWIYSLLNTIISVIVVIDEIVEIRWILQSVPIDVTVAHYTEEQDSIVIQVNPDTPEKQPLGTAEEKDSRIHSPVKLTFSTKVTLLVDERESIYTKLFYWPTSILQQYYQKAFDSGRPSGLV